MPSDEKYEVTPTYEAPKITVLGEVTELTQMPKHGSVHDFFGPGEHGERGAS
jgi:hypothetical protein